MSHHLDDAALLAAELLARRWLPRQHPKVRRALVDADLWAATQDRLAQVGLRLIDNLYADHVSVALLRPAESAVFGEAGLNSHNNIDLPRDAVSLLVVLWALIILPKRERQVNRQKLGDDGQGDMFSKDAPVERGDAVSSPIVEASLLADFANTLGHKTYVQGKLLSRLAQLGFIERKAGMIHEGPLLDVLLDYRTLADRIVHGTLGEVLAQAGHPLPNLEAFAEDDTAHVEEADAEDDY
jgi:hypothetical protein